MDVVWCAAVIHMFPWNEQVAACKRLIHFTKGPGSMIMACQVGKQETAGELRM